MASDTNIGGQIAFSEEVVASIAATAARTVKGIHSLGKSRLLDIPLVSSETRGVAAEVGQEEAAIDLEIVIEYGINLREVAHELRSIVAEHIDAMTGRKVVEININVVGIRLEEEEEPEEESPRVR